MDLRASVAVVAATAPELVLLSASLAALSCRCCYCYWCCVTRLGVHFECVGDDCGADDVDVGDCCCCCCQ